MPTKKTLWNALPSADWDLGKARHLASRLGFSVHPKIVETIHKLGPRKTVAKHLFAPKPMPPPSEVVSMRETAEEMLADGPIRDREQRRLYQKLNRESYADYAVKWYDFACNPERSIQEKMVLFFQDVWVVAFQGVKSAPALFDYQARIRQSIAGTYPEMCLRLSQSWAMVRYLNLNQNRKGAPNENFARELFELFTLGEGNYSEEDIKEASRALTGYMANRQGKVVFRPQRHDDGRKTVFGKTGRFKLEDIIRLVFQQPAAARFLPAELCKAYLSQEPLPEPLIEELATLWRKNGYSLPYLYETLFASELFYKPEYRANLIKAPVHYYLGMLQDFELGVPPLPRASFRLNRQMGQPFFNPPNVRGWVGGKAWINSATLSARRQAAESLFFEYDEKRLNADEIKALEKVRAAGQTSFSIHLPTVRDWLTQSDDPVASLAQRLYVDSDPKLLHSIAPASNLDLFIANNANLRSLLLATLSAPSYHLH